MADRKHIICTLCNEPRCMDEDCFFHSCPLEITTRIRNLISGGKNPGEKTRSVAGRNRPTVPKKRTLDFRVLPAYFQGGKKIPQPMIKQEKRYIVCYVCGEPKCLEDECLFLTDPRDLTRGMKNHINFINIPVQSGNAKGIAPGNEKETPANLLYVNAVKLFWFCFVIGAILYLMIIGGLPFMSAKLFSMQSLLPLQVYISIFGIGVTAACLAMANLLGTEQKTAK